MEGYKKHRLMSCTCFAAGGPIGRSKAPKPDDFREAYDWFRQNTHPKSRIMAWYV